MWPPSVLSMGHWLCESLYEKVSQYYNKSICLEDEQTTLKKERERVGKLGGKPTRCCSC